MRPNVFCCAPNDDLHSVLKIMVNQQVHRLPVVDGNGALAGMLMWCSMLSIDKTALVFPGTW